jgi:hypothetical protein
LRARLPAERAQCLRWFNAIVEAAGKPVEEQPAAFAALPPAPTVEKPIISRFLSAFDKIASAFWRSVAEGRCAVVGIACERFRLKHNRWPENLAELSPEFLPAVPLDPYDGQPLRYTKLEDGVIIHSIGPKPEPGRARRHRAGVPEGIETAFRLWNPDQRRRPPPADPPKPKDEDDP